MIGHCFVVRFYSIFGTFDLLLEIVGVHLEILFERINRH